MSAKYLIVGDIHNKIDIVQHLIETVPHDIFVALGDYWDHFNDTPNDARKVAAWLKDSLRQPNRIHLWGNHDLPMAFPNQHTWCSGHTEEKQKAAAEVITSENWALFEPFYYIKEGNWLLSHAGINRSIFECPQRGLTLEVIREKCERGLASLAFGQYSHEFGAGYSRGGRQPKGGIVWADFLDELTPLKEFRQIVGHRPVEKPSVMFWGESNARFIRSFDRFNGWDHPEIIVDIDCHLKWYATLQDGRISFHKTP